MGSYLPNYANRINSEQPISLCRISLQQRLCRIYSLLHTHRHTRLEPELQKVSMDGHLFQQLLHQSFISLTSFDTVVGSLPICAAIALNVIPLHKHSWISILFSSCRCLFFLADVIIVWDLLSQT